MFLSTKGPGGIDELHGIGFVVPSSVVRLGPAQKYIFHTVLSLFGQDIANNIIMLFTFADEEKPKALGAVEADNIPHVDYFKFNNSVLFSNLDQNYIRQCNYKDAMKNFKALLHMLQGLKTHSLTLTRELILERQHLELLLENIERNIKTLAGKQAEFQTEKTLFADHYQEIEEGKKLIYIGEKSVTIVKPTKYSSTNCLECKVTCHQQCLACFNSIKWSCEAMEGFSRVCKVCPGKCHWKKHENAHIVYDSELMNSKIDIADIRRRYERVAGRKLTPDEVAEEIQGEINVIDEETTKMIMQATSCVNRLEKIALRSDPRTSSEYIGILITNEESCPTNG